MNAVFRLRTYYRNLALVCLLFSVSMIVASTLVLARDGETLAAVLGGGIWAFFVGLSAWILLAYYRESLCIQDGTIIQKGVLRTKVMVLSELIDVRWETGGIFLRSQSGRITINLDNFLQEQRQQLIYMIRQSTPRSIQQEWDRFCYEVAVPLLEHSYGHPLRENTILFTRWHYDRIFIPLVPFVAVVGAGFAVYLQDVRWLFVPAPFAGLWLLLRSSIPAKGLVLLNQSKFDNRFIFGLVIWGAVGIGWAILCEVFKCRLPNLLEWIGMLLWLCVLLVYVYRVEQQRKQDKQVQYGLAVQVWEQYEANGLDSLNVTPKDDAPPCS